MPLSLSSCYQVLEDNYDVMKELFGEAEHINTMNSMNVIHEKFQKHREMTSSSTGGGSGVFNFFPLSSAINSSQEVEVEDMSPVLTYFGDEKSDIDMVYAVGVNPLRKRVTLAFRGSVTATDFQKDAMMSLNQQPNPVREIDSDQPKEVGIHHGFYEYLLKPRANGMNKYQEIMGHVQALFLEYEHRKDYKLYVTGHSLGGALATLFSLYAASSAASSDGIIPSPISCVSVASPRVGDQGFQTAFCRLEELGHLRHLRIANDGDPVTMMPSATAKKVFSRLSPITYLAFKLIDNKFDEKENFHHTGIKLRLAKDQWEFQFLGTPMISCAVNDDDDASCESGNSRGIRSLVSRSIKPKSARQDSFQQTQMPDVLLHLGNAYTENLVSVKNDLLDLSLNDLYKEKAASVFSDKAIDR